MTFLHVLTFFFLRMLNIPTEYPWFSGTYIYIYVCIYTTESGLWLNRSEKAHVLNSSIQATRKCFSLRSRVLLTGLLASTEPTDSLTHYPCYHTGDWLLPTYTQLKVLLHTPAFFSPLPVLFCHLLPSTTHSYFPSMEWQESQHLGSH